MAKEPSRSVAATGTITNLGDGFEALLRKEFRPQDSNRQAKIESAVRALADEALKSEQTLADDVVGTIRQMLGRLQKEQKSQPESADKIQTVIDQLTDLLGYMDGKDAAQAMLEQVLANPGILSALNAGESELDKEEQFPKTAAYFGLRKIRSDQPFHRHTLTNLFASITEHGRRHVDRLVYRVLTETAHDRGTVLEEEFTRRVGRYDDLGLRDEILQGSLGTLADGDRHFIQLSFDDLHAAWQNERRFILFLKDRLDESTDSPHPPSIVERTERLAAYAKEHGEAGLQEYARLLFPEWALPASAVSNAAIMSNPLPTEAPEIYQGLRGPETPPQFVQRVYGEWLGHGLTRAHIRKLDPVLYTAMNNWLKKPGCEWPADVDLPTLKEQNSRDIQALREGAPVNVTLQEMRRLQGAIQRRDEGRVK